MIELYPVIRSAHITLAVLSGSVFFLRGIAVLAGRGAIANQPIVRGFSYLIDTALLGAAISLLLVLRLPLTTPWLMTKLALVLGYIVLGSLALRRAPTARSRRLCFVGAAATYLAIVGIALAHDPRGWMDLLSAYALI